MERHLGAAARMTAKGLLVDDRRLPDAPMLPFAVALRASQRLFTTLLGGMGTG